MDIREKSAMANEMYNTFLANDYKWDKEEIWEIVDKVVTDKQRNYFWYLAKNEPEQKKSFIYSLIRQYVQL